MRVLFSKLVDGTPKKLIQDGENASNLRNKRKKHEEDRMRKVETEQINEDEETIILSSLLTNENFPVSGPVPIVMITSALSRDNKERNNTSGIVCTKCCSGRPSINGIESCNNCTCQQKKQKPDTPKALS